MGWVFLWSTATGATFDTQDREPQSAREGDPLWAHPETVDDRAAELLEAKRFVEQKKWAEAVVLFRSLEQKSDLSSTTQRNLSLELSRALLYSGRREEALSLLEQWASKEKKGTFREFWIRRIQVMSRVFITNETSQVYQDGVRLLQEGKHRAARERFEKALEREPDNMEILARIGQCFLLDKDDDSAAERLRSALQLNPYEPELRLWLGRALHRRGEITEGIQELKRAYREMKGTEHAVIWYAEALVTLNQRGAAIQVLERDLAQNPFHVGALLALARYRLQGSTKDMAALWAARKDLQLASSRLDAYLSSNALAGDSDFRLDMRTSPDLLREEIRKLFQQIDTRLNPRPKNS